MITVWWADSTFQSDLRICSRTDTNDEDSSGRPSVISDGLLQKVEEIVRNNRLVTLIDHYEHFLRVSRTLLGEISSEILGGHKKSCAWWATRTLTPEHRRNRVLPAHQFSNRFEREREEILDLIVTGHETRILPPYLRVRKKPATTSSSCRMLDGVGGGGMLRVHTKTGLPTTKIHWTRAAVTYERGL